MSARSRIRDQLRDFVPWWLSDRHYTDGKTVGFRYLWAMIAMLDCYMEFGLQSLIAPWPAVGTPTALPRIARSRGITRGQADTDATFALKLIDWLNKWAGAGTQRQLAIEIQEYLGNHPRVRVVNRAGRMVTVETDGTVSMVDCAWDWDSVSNPERVGYWSELWIIVYPSQWAHTASINDGPTVGMGHTVSRVEVDAIRGIVAQWKGAHAYVRALIWSDDAAAFDPSTPGTLPNGNWGNWGTRGNGSRVLSDRDTAASRYWEF